MSVTTKTTMNRGHKLMTLVSIFTILALLTAMITSISGKALANSDDVQGSVITWQTERVTNYKAFAWMGDRHMRLDSTGRPHVAYGGDHLYYAYYNGSAWVVETVDSYGGVGLYASLALDSNNRPHISYYSASSGALKYARNLNGTWERFVLDTPNMANTFEFTDGENPSVDDLPIRPVNVKDWAAAEGGFDPLIDSIQFNVAMKGRGLFTSIAIDPYNEPHIAYYDSVNGNLKYAHKVYSGWRIDAIDTDNDTGQYASIAVGKDSNNKLFTHFSYYDVTVKDLRYAKWSAETTSVVERISIDGTSDGDFGKFSSIALTNDNTPLPRISYYAYINSTTSYLKYAALKNDSWVKEAVTDENQLSGKYSSLALDASNNPHISYLNATSGKLKLAIPNSTGWSTTEIASVSPNGGVYSSIAVDKNVADIHSDARVSFYDAGTGLLKFTSQSSGNWNTPLTVDGMGDLGAYNAVAFDTAGNPHISFFDDTHDDLMYIRSNGTSWEGPFVVDQTGEVGLYSDIAMSGNTPHIVSYNASTTCLRYATWSVDHWVSENVEQANTNGYCPKVGKYASITIDHLNRPHIAYYDENNGNLKWAYKDNGTWKIAYVDSSSDDVGLFTSIAIDAANNPHISYFDQTHIFLKYATLQTNGVWHIEDHVNQINTQGGQYSQITLDNLGHPHIAYMDDSGEDGLKHAWKDEPGTTFWGYETIDPGIYISGNSIPPIVPFSIVADQNGAIHFSYYDFTLKQLRYARKANGLLSYRVIDVSGDTGQYSSIGVNSLGVIGISYYDALNADLMYAKVEMKLLPYSLFLPAVLR